MKNNKKGSATLWILIIILMVTVGGGLYVFNSGKGCRITDDTGKTTYGPCPENKADYSFNADDNTDLGRIKKAMQDQESKYLANSPSGFLVPTTVPSGYKPQTHPTSFTSDSASYYYSTNRGVPADKNLTFEENGSSYGTFVNFDAYLTYMAKDSKIVKEFTYNGGRGKVLTYTSNSSPNYQLIYDHQGKLLIIAANNDLNITPEILVELLKAMTVTK